MSQLKNSTSSDIYKVYKRVNHNRTRSMIIKPASHIKGAVCEHSCTLSKTPTKMKDSKIATPLDLNRSYSSSINLSNIKQYLEKRLSENLKRADNSDPYSIFRAHIDILKKLCNLDLFGDILKSIVRAISDFVTSHAEHKELSKDLNLLHEAEVNTLKQRIRSQEIIIKNIQQKLKHLSLLNIELQENIDKIKEENSANQKGQKNIKIIERDSEQISFLKGIQLKTIESDSVDQKAKQLGNKEKFLSVLVKACKEKDLNPNELFRGYINGRVSKDSLNMSIPKVINY